MPVGVQTIVPRAAPRFWASAGLCVVLTLAPVASWGQAVPGPTKTMPPEPLPAPSDDDHLFGNWGGVRTYLGNLGIDLTIDALTEFAGNVAGGTKHGATFASQVEVRADIDWGKLAGLTGFSTHTAIVNRSGSSDSVLFGDKVNAVQEIYGGGGDVVAHFVYTYAEQSLLGGRLDIAAGRLPVLHDFAASPLYCDFVNVSICGNPGSLSAGDIGLSVFPDATWGGRVRVRPTASTYVQAGAYEVSQGLFTPYFNSGWRFDTSLDSGVEVPVEVGYLPRLGAAQMPGHYKLGFGYDSSSDKDLYLDAAGVPTLQSGEPLASHRGSFRFWALADQMLLRNGAGDQDGLIAFAAFVRGDPAITPYATQVTAGLLDKAFWAARPQDQIGALATYQKMSSALGKEEALDQEFDMPLPNGATGGQTSEIVFELNYNIQVYHGVTFQPDVQYVVRPNAETDIKNATVLGFRTHVTF